jgi:hypothetical protein
MSVFLSFVPLFLDILSFSYFLFLEIRLYLHNYVRVQTARAGVCRFMFRLLLVCLIFVIHVRICSPTDA